MKNVEKRGVLIEGLILISFVVVAFLVSSLDLGLVHV